MTLEQFLEKFDGVQKRTSYAMVLCPAHADKQKSLSVKRGADGRILLSCKAGCTAEQIVGAMGLKIKDLFEGDFSKPAQNNVEATYTYTDASGVPIMRKHRKQTPEGKRFFWECYSQGSWVNGLSTANDRKNTLYNLPGIHKAIAKGDPVYLCNGEKAADRVRLEGRCGTCSPHGESKSQSELKFSTKEAEVLRGAKMVYIIADRDSVGEENAKWVSEVLLAAKIPVQIVQSATSGDKDDAYDHLEAGYELDQLVRRTDLEPSRYGRFGAVRTAKEVLPEAVPWMVRPIIARKTITLIEGPPGTGKSYLSTAIAAAVSCGGMLPICKDPVKKGRALLIHTEDQANFVTRPRLEALGADLSFIDLMDDVVPFDRHGLADFRTLLGDLKPEYVSLDPLTAFLDAALKARNPDVDIHYIMDYINKLSQELDVAIIGLRHLRKSHAADDDPTNSGYGDVAIIGKARSALQVKTVSTHDGVKDVEMKHIKTNIGRLMDPWRYTLRENASNPDLADFLWAAGPRTPEQVKQNDIERSLGKEISAKVFECAFWVTERVYGEPVIAEELLRESKNRGWNGKILKYAMEFVEVQSPQFQIGDLGIGDGVKRVWIPNPDAPQRLLTTEIDPKSPMEGAEEYDPFSEEYPQE